MARLSDRKIRSLTEPGYYGDGDGLYLRLIRQGVGSWVLRTRVHGKKVEIGLGSMKDVPLAGARVAAAQKRAVARAGGDPRQDKAKRIPTFKEAAETVHRDHILATSGNGKHKAQWINTLTVYAFPSIGHLPVDKVEQADILRVLRPIWLTKAETARRVRQRLERIFAWARTAGYRTGVNPVDDVEHGLPSQKVKTQHFHALPWQELPALMARLDHVDTISSLALRFAILTCARSGEVREATWSEIDLDTALWTVPAERMKAGVEHRVPLTPETMAILAKMQGLDAKLVFPGQKLGRPMSDMTLTALLRRLKVESDGKIVTAHGFRSTFRDWVSEATDISGDLAEHCLAHRVGGAVQRAYARSDLLDKRRKLLEAWEAHCLSARTVAKEEAA
jgi:integrase